MNGLARMTAATVGHALALILTFFMLAGACSGLFGAEAGTAGGSNAMRLHQKMKV